MLGCHFVRTFTVKDSLMLKVIGLALFFRLLNSPIPLSTEIQQKGPVSNILYETKNHP
jgi:hypothetical protein